jgi:hypothetical protein
MTEMSDSGRSGDSMYTDNARRIAVAVRQHRSGATVVALRKTAAPARGFHDKTDQELETLMAAISLGAVLLTLLISLAMKLWVG